MTVIADFEPFAGEHCETNATGNLLKAAGMELSEPMLFGLGEGLAYGVFVMRNMPAPFIGGRPRPEEITKTLAGHLGLEVEYRETRSKKKAWDNLAGFIDSGQPVGVKINCRYLDHFSSDFDFAGHYLAAYGYDADTIYVVDTCQQHGAVTTSRARFEEGRLWRGPMASNALTWTLSATQAAPDWPAALRQAIASNARKYLNPPIKNFGAAGIRKTADLIRKWPDTHDADAIAQTGTLMERGGTGGGLFRYFYRDFLAEAYAYLDEGRLLEIGASFGEAGRLWTEISGHLQGFGTDGPTRLDAARDALLEVADLEHAAVTELANLFGAQA